MTSDGLEEQNPYGQRLPGRSPNAAKAMDGRERRCQRSASLLVAHVERPHRTPRAAQLIPQKPLCGHAAL